MLIDVQTSHYNNEIKQYIPIVTLSLHAIQTQLDKNEQVSNEDKSKPYPLSNLYVGLFK